MNNIDKYLAIIILIFVFCLITYFCKRDIEYFKNNSFDLYYFYSDNCGYCKKFKPVLDSAIKEIRNDINLIEISGKDENEIKLMKENNVNGVPMLIMVKNNNKKIYQGDRTKEDLIDFIVKN